MQVVDITEIKKDRILKKIVNSTKEGGYLIAEACFKLAEHALQLDYVKREAESQLIANERNNNKVK